MLAEPEPCRRDLKRARIEVDVTPAQAGHLAAALAGKRKLPRDRIPIALDVFAYNKLVLINAAASINDLRVPPGNRLEKLAGARAGQYSIRVNNRWRICFTWSSSGAGNLELVDYH